MLSRANTFHSTGNSTSRFNVPPRHTDIKELELIKLPPIKQSETAAPHRAADTNNELVRLRAQQAFNVDARLRFSETSLFSARKENKTAISIHPKFLDEPASSRFYYPGYSPYLMERNSQERYFMSGYSGFVPRLRHLDGAATFPVLTHDAMDDFDEAKRAHAAALADLGTGASIGSLCVLERGRVRGRRGEAVIYRKCEGLLPNYQGHVPGHHRRYGSSFGRITVNARELP